MIVRRIRVDDETSEVLVRSNPVLRGFSNANVYGGHEVGGLHPVMAIAAYKYLSGGEDLHLCLLLDEGEDSWFPVIYPVELYEVVDPRLPNGWAMSFDEYDQSSGIRMISFEEAVADPDFFGRLVDADELPQEEGQRLISIYKRRVQEVMELSKDFFSAQNNGTA